MPPAIWYPMQLKSIIEESSNTRRFFFNLQSSQIFEFQPGQFLTCDLPIGEKRVQRWRSYSIANCNQKDNQIEFCISYKTGGLASEYFFNKIKSADTFNVKGPEGNFLLPENNKINLFLICTGTGLAPFRSMLQHLEQTQNHYNSIHLIYGTRKVHDIIYNEDMKLWTKKIAQFNSYICLSRESEIPVSLIKNQKYHRGYVHPVYQDILNQNSYPHDSVHFMICGWSEMIDEAVATLFSEFKFKREQIRFELYG